MGFLELSTTFSESGINLRIMVVYELCPQAVVLSFKDRMLVVSCILVQSKLHFQSLSPQVLKATFWNCNC